MKQRGAYKIKIIFNILALIKNSSIFVYSRLSLEAVTFYCVNSARLGVFIFVVSGLCFFILL